MTIGHSTLEIEVFLRALTGDGCRVLVDVRRFPGSRRYPWFGQAALFAALERVGIRGIWREGLGGRREALKDSLNTGWRNESFRGYADYMQTEAFAGEIDWLVGLKELDRVTVMCAEAVPARGVGVEDVFVDKDGRSSRKPHAMTEFARVEGTRVWYPGEAQLFV